MNEREELAGLRRLAELEVKAAGLGPETKGPKQGGIIKDFVDSGGLGVFGMLATEQGRQNLGDAVGGAVRGAGTLGAALLWPVDKSIDAVKGDRDPTITGLVTGKQPISRNAERRAEMDAGLRSMGVDTDSNYFGVGKLGGEIAGTAGVGPALALGARSLGAAPSLVNAIATGGFRAAPEVVPLLSKAGALNALTRATGGAVTGGTAAGLIDPENTRLGAAIGGGLPVVGTALGRSVQYIGNKLRGGPVSGDVAALASRAKELGIKIPADRIVDSKPMNALAGSLNYVPFSGRAATEEAMNSQLNQSLSRTFGQDSSNVTMALRKADVALGGQFDEFLRSNTVRVDKQFIDELAEATNQASRELGSDGASIIGKQVDEILSKAATGEIDGQAAYNIKKTLDRIGKRNSPEAWYALDLKQKLMDVLNRSVGPEKASEFAKLRQQYGSMLALEKLAKNGAEGEVSVARLANLKNIRNPEIQELADIAAQFLKPREGAHGSAQRAYGTMGAAAAGYFGGPTTLAAGIGLGRGTNMLLNSNLGRNAVLGTASPAVENALSKLLPLTYRTAPVISGQ